MPWSRTRAGSVGGAAAALPGPAVASRCDRGWADRGRAVIEVSAPAKLTLSLRITGVRDDGYHEIDAEMATLDFFDRLEISPSPDNGIEVRMLDASGNDFAAALPATDNLVARALALAERGARVTVHKRIPAGAGLGGGSADAAAVLRWAGFTDTARAASISADVAFCLTGGRGPGARHRGDRRAASLRSRAIHPVAGAAVMQHRSRLRGVGRAGRPRGAPWQRSRGGRAARRSGTGSLARRAGRLHRADPQAGGKRQHLVRGWRPSRASPRGGYHDRAVRTGGREGVGGAPAKDRARYWRRRRWVHGSSYLRRW